MPSFSNASDLSDSQTWSIRPLEEGDCAALLQLNAGNYPAVWPLTKEDLTALLNFAGYHLVAVNAANQLLGYLLSFPNASNYDDTEIREFRRLLPEQFVYICQLVIATGHRRHGIGRAFYNALMDHAHRIGARTLCCDVNTRPPNPASIAFHHDLGFVQIGEALASNGFAIALLAKKW